VTDAAVLGVIVFASSNVDDMFVLFGFFVDPHFRGRDIVFGQYLGMGALFLASTAASLVSLVLNPAYVGLLGVAPVAVGLKRLIGQLGEQKGYESELRAHPKANAVSQCLIVASVTVANGGDNLSIYIPVFAAQTLRVIAIMGATFVLMTALWCAAAQWLARHSTLGAPIRRYSYRVMPFVFIGWGLFTLIRAESYRLLAR
jgi:cadmium resistance protein CadD (predicted permease)